MKVGTSVNFPRAFVAALLTESLVYSGKTLNLNFRLKYVRVR